ncbi:MAG: hypothetical protein PVH48_05690 [Cyclobacteriaceae bacterium]|jgi:hypothetical protein
MMTNPLLLFGTLFFFILLLSGCHKVSIVDGVMDEGQECFEIRMKNATLYYQKTAGGFSSIIDKEGNDWIGFRKDTIQGYPQNAASEYRGLPNLVFGSGDSGAGHPGFDKCTSSLVSYDKIKTVSNSGKWEWTWTFYSDYARLIIEKVDPGHSYWFLYEGIPGGKYSPHSQYWGTDKGGPNKNIPDYYFNNAEYNNWQWIYLGEESVGRVFYILHEQSDQLTDTFSYLGNTSEGVISPDGMVVFGFGRDKAAKSLFQDKDQTFVIGFEEMGITSVEDHDQFNSIMKRFIVD